jgi:hypothetical protein
MLELLQKPQTILDEKDCCPQNGSDCFVALAGWKFRVSSTMHFDSTPEQVIDGWNMFQNDMGRNIMDRLIQPFVYQAVIDAKSISEDALSNQEPNLIELLRLSYWYGICSKIDAGNTFASKRKEIREKLTRGLLT